jgi:hypothetical protein
MENVDSGGVFWFWIGVLRTAFSMLWREFFDEPARMMGLAVGGVVLELVMMVAFVTCAALLGAVLGGILHLTGTPDGPQPVLAALGWALARAIVWGLVPLQVGCWLARRAPGRELAPCVAFMIFDVVVWGSLGLMWEGAQYSLFQFVVKFLSTLAMSALYMLPMIAGAAWVRRKRMSR